MTKRVRATTIVTVVRDGVLAMAADSQVTWGSTALADKGFSKIHEMDGTLFGFTGLRGGLIAVVELLEKHAPDWRAAARATTADKLANGPERPTVALFGPLEGAVGVLNAMDGSVILPDKPVLGIGSGGDYAMAAGQAFLEVTDWSAARIAAEAIRIACELCIYTAPPVEVRTAKLP